MKLKDIKPGMIVVTRNTEKFLYINGLFKRANGYISDFDYYDDLLSSTNNMLDIMEVYKVVNDCSLKETFHKQNLELIWERKESLNFEHDEIIEVWSEIDKEYIKRHFAKFNEYGWAGCYPNGASSITNDKDGNVSYWKKYRKWDKGE